MRADRQAAVLNLFSKGWSCTANGDVLGPPGKNVKYYKNNKGYLHIRYNHHRYYNHQMVWIFFFKKIPEGLEINHKDGDRLNNKISNLEVCTHRENILHSIRIGKQKAIGAKGEDNMTSRLTLDIIHQIRYLFEHGYPQVEIARAYEISKTHIFNICRRHRWGHL